MSAKSAFSLKSGAPLRYLTPQGAAAGSHPSRYRLRLALAVPATRASACGLILHGAAARPAPPGLSPESAEGIAVWVEAYVFF